MSRILTASRRCGPVERTGTLAMVCSTTSDENQPSATSIMRCRGSGSIDTIARGVGVGVDTNRPRAATASSTLTFSRTNRGVVSRNRSSSAPLSPCNVIVTPSVESDRID